MSRHTITTMRNQRLMEAAISGSRDLGSWLQRMFSLSYNVRTERVVADPDYSLAKQSISSSEADPRSTEPNAGVTWDLMGYYGLNGYLSFTSGSGTATVELYAYDRQNKKWFLVSSVAGVSHLEEFDFGGEVKGRLIFLRIVSPSSEVAVFATPE